LTRAISHCNFQLDVILFIGTAYRIDTGTAGDVAVPSATFTYEPDSSEPIYVNFSDHGLTQRARREARREDWLNRVRENTSNPSPAVHVAPIIAVKDKYHQESQLLRALRSNFTSNQFFLSGRKELKFLNAMTSGNKTPSIMVHGICDLRRTRSNQTSKEEIAVKHAVAFAFEILAKLNGDGTTTSIPIGRKECELLLIPFSNLPSSMAKILTVAAESDGFCHICALHNGKQYEERTSVSELREEVIEFMESHNSQELASFAVRWERNANFSVNKVMQRLSVTGFFGNPESCLLISDRLGLPWEFIRVNKKPIGILVQIAYTLEEHSDFDDYSCAGDVLHYGECSRESWESFPTLDDLVLEMGSCGERYGMLMVDAYNTTMSIDPTDHFDRTGFFSNHSRIVFVSGYIDSGSLTHKKFLETFHEVLNACGVIGARILTSNISISNDVASRIIDLFLETLAQQPLLTIPAILRYMRSSVDERISRKIAGNNDSSSLAELYELHAGVFQYCYHGKPNVTLCLNPVESS
jgi:hypothetical protein